MHFEKAPLLTGTKAPSEKKASGGTVESEQ